MWSEISWCSRVQPILIATLQYQNTQIPDSWSTFQLYWWCTSSSPCWIDHHTSLWYVYSHSWSLCTIPLISLQGSILTALIQELRNNHPIVLSEEDNCCSRRMIEWFPWDEEFIHNWWWLGWVNSSRRSLIDSLRFIFFCREGWLS